MLLKENNKYYIHILKEKIVITNNHIFDINKLEYNSYKQNKNINIIGNKINYLYHKFLI